MSSTERVRKWRAEQRRKAQLYDQLEAARRAHLERQAVSFAPFMPEGGTVIVAGALSLAINDPLCFDFSDKLPGA